ncbi:hypothetical protein BGZ76_011007 [Entomortierella beljakovae]|nr:hypothetical protein BGZ76_011007 [Entomortierella beljakovae]
MLAKGFKWTITMVAILSLAASTVMAAGIPVDDPEADHSNYGDIGKAKEFAKEHMADHGKNLSHKEEMMMLFSLHDANKDGFLDGIELRSVIADMAKSLGHIPLEQMVTMIDHVLGEDDLNNE